MARRSVGATVVGEGPKFTLPEIPGYECRFRLGARGRCWDCGEPSVAYVSYRGEDGQHVGGMRVCSAEHVDPEGFAAFMAEITPSVQWTSRRTRAVYVAIDRAD